jgi:hypothetical protein
MRRILLPLCLALVSACLWRSYADVMRVHLDVLTSLAEKATFNAAAGQRPTSNDVTELTYPLQRARQFAYSYRSYASRESYARFVAALDRYQSMVEAIDGARGDEVRWAAEREALLGQAAAWRAAVEQVRAALERER